MEKNKGYYEALRDAHGDKSQVEFGVHGWCAKNRGGCEVEYGRNGDIADTW